MTILDRYLFRLFMRSYAACFLSMLGLYVMIDLFTNLDEFSKEASGAALFANIVRYYAIHTFDYFGRLSPMITQTAAMYSLADLRRHNELTPMLAAGIPTRRAIAPILFGVLVVVAMGAANREFAMPYYSEFLQRGHDDVEGASHLSVGSHRDADSMLLRADWALRDGQQLINVKVTLSDLQEITAPHGCFATDSDGTAGVLLDDVKSAEFQPTDKIKRLPGGKLFVTTTLTFGEMVRSNGWTRFASAAELIEELGKPQAGNLASIRALIHSRLMQPVANLVLVLLGIPFVLSWERRKFFMSLLISMALSGAYFVLDAVATYLAGFGYVDAMFAAWLPIFAFLPVAASLSHRIGT